MLLGRFFVSFFFFLRSRALLREEPEELFSLMTNLPKLSNSPLQGYQLVSQQEDIYGSARDACRWTPRPAQLNKNKLSKPTWSEPGEARKAQQDLSRQRNCKQNSDDPH